MLSLLMSLLACCALAFGGSQKLTYDLTVDGKHVGQRELTVRTIPSSSGEVRILESFTELTVSVAGQSYQLKNRATLKAGGTPGFTSNIEENGKLREVQGRMLPDRRWLVTVTEAGQVKTWTLRASEITLSSLDLLDPVRHALLLNGASANLLVAETGGISAGAVEDLGEGALTVGGVEVMVRRAAFTPDTGRMELSWSSDGLLLAYETRVLGKAVKAVVTEVPAPLTFGTVETDALQVGGAVNEEAL